MAVRYVTWLPDGTQLDHNVAEAPFEFRVGRGEVVAGLREGVVGMRVGGQRMLVVPPSLAYGRAGRTGVPANAVLVFLVELVASTGGA